MNKAVCRDGPSPSHGGGGAHPVGSLTSTRQTARVSHCPGPATALTRSNNSSVPRPAASPFAIPPRKAVLMPDETQHRGLPFPHGP